MSVNPLIIGHRGASAVAPENTMAAFHKAIEVGAEGIEFDVRLSKDGVPVVIHDETLQRTAGRPERVADLSSTDLETTDVGSWFSRARGLETRDFAGETIPTLRRLLDEFSNSDALLYLELKCSPLEVRQIAVTICQMLANNQIRDRVIIECFDLSAIAEVKRLAPELKTAALFEPKISDPVSLLPGQMLIERAKAVSADQIVLHRQLVHRRTIEQARRAELKVVVWTVDDPSWLARSRKYGIDCIITNDPALLVQKRNATYAI
jgi:glycerophosphoryl diester phosphodiesterase